MTSEPRGRGVRSGAWKEGIMGFYGVTAARDTSGLYDLPQMNHPPQEVGGVLTGAKGCWDWTDV